MGAAFHRPFTVCIVALRRDGGGRSRSGAGAAAAAEVDSADQGGACRQSPEPGGLPPFTPPMESPPPSSPPPRVMAPFAQHHSSNATANPHILHFLLSLLMPSLWLGALGCEVHAERPILFIFYLKCRSLPPAADGGRATGRPAAARVDGGAADADAEADAGQAGHGGR